MKKCKEKLGLTKSASKGSKKKMKNKLKVAELPLISEPQHKRESEKLVSEGSAEIQSGSMINKTAFNNILIGKTKHGLDDNALLSITEKIGPEYRIAFDDVQLLTKLSVGVSSYIFIGKSNRLPKSDAIAVKLFLPRDKFLDSFERECEIMRLIWSGQLDGTLVVKFHRIVIDEHLMILMDFLPNGSLFSFVKKETDRCTLPFVLTLYSQVLSGVAALHSFDPPLAHRDLKSLNILIAEDFSPRLIDFGQSCYVLESNREQRRGLCGTLAYCDPNLFQAQPFELASDVFSLGILLWELLEVTCKKTANAPYSEYGFSYDFQIIVKSVGGLRPTVDSSTPKTLADLYWRCVHPVSATRPTIDELSTLISSAAKECDSGTLLRPLCDPSDYNNGWIGWEPPSEEVIFQCSLDTNGVGPSERANEEDATKPRRTLKRHG